MGLEPKLIVLTALAVVACAQPPPRVPSLNDIKWGSSVAWAGLELLGHECARRVRALVGTDPASAVRLGRLCLAADAVVEPAHDRIVAELATTSLVLGATARIGCAGVVYEAGYWRFLDAMQIHGFVVTEDHDFNALVSEGLHDAIWLERLAPRCVDGAAVTPLAP